MTTELIYRRTINGLIRSIYKDQKHNSKQRNMKMTDYSIDELMTYLKDNEKFMELYNNWVISSYKHYLRPSCDRLNDYKPYTFSNIQIITWGENKEKGYSDQINGINTKQCKAILQYDLEDTFIKEYYSIQQAERETGIHHVNIIKACKGQRNHAGNYYWEYKSKFI